MLGGTRDMGLSLPNQADAGCGHNVPHQGLESRLRFFDLGASKKIVRSSNAAHRKGS